MPSVSLSQNRYVHSAAARGEKWAIKWLREQRGHKVPRVQRVGKKPGRPKLPLHAASKDALWKRAQRADNRPPNRGMIRHHPDNAYGRESSKTVYMSRAQHNREHKRAESITAQVKRLRAARKRRAA